MPTPISFYTLAHMATPFSLLIKFNGDQPWEGGVEAGTKGRACQEKLQNLEYYILDCLSWRLLYNWRLLINH